MLLEHILDLQNKRIVCAAKENDGKNFCKEKYRIPLCTDYRRQCQK